MAKFFLMKLSICIPAFFLSMINICFCQKPLIKVVTSGTNSSLRGMSIPMKNVIWVSGSNGTVGKSTDGGNTWNWITIHGYEKRDFRDIESFDSRTAIAMAVDNPAIIVKTTDGGATWKKVFERTMEGMFLDAMDFKNKKEGICIGDPIKAGEQNLKYFYIIRTFDGGETWTETPGKQRPVADSGEAIFAASGTNISFFDNPDFEYGFVTGGLVSKLHLIGRQGKQDKTINIPIIQGGESKGTFSMVTDRQKSIFCIGGDYKVPNEKQDIFVFSTNEGAKWTSLSANAPSGYRSCIRIIRDKTLVACGTTGVDISTNGFNDWKKVSAESFNVCMPAPGKQVFFAGEKGKIGRLW